MKRREFLRAAGAGLAEASYKAAKETYAEIGAANPRFKKIHDHLVAFRNESYSWWQVCDLTFDTFQVRMLGRS